MNTKHCIWCDRPFVPKNKNHKFCTSGCGYCYRSGGTPYSERGWYWSDEENRLVIPEDKVKKEEPKNYQEHKRQKKSTVYTRPSKAGCVYLMKADNGLFKIGRATNIENRLKDLNRQIPITVEVIHTVKTDKPIETEKLLHNRYAAQRIKYEWFSLSSDQVAEILALNDFSLDGQ